MRKDSAIAQLVEQVAVNHPVTGSSPVRGATFFLTYCSAIAQLVEQVAVNHPVTGSSPVRGATFFLTYCSAIAQLVEQVAVNHPVTGSSPVRGATFLYRRHENSRNLLRHHLPLRLSWTRALFPA